MHTDAYNISARNGIINCLVSVIALGISCSKKQPRERIPIQDAAIEMHDSTNTNHCPHDYVPDMTMFSLRLLLLLLLLSTSMSISTLAAAPANDDESALLAFKAAPIDVRHPAVGSLSRGPHMLGTKVRGSASAAISGSGYGDPLASWNKSSAGGYCSWEGVRCRGRRRRVLHLGGAPTTLRFCTAKKKRGIVETVIWDGGWGTAGFGLTGVLSPAIGNLSYLWTLNLSNNGLTNGIPESLGRLQHLNNLDLSQNYFSGKIPANLCSCSSLVSLTLSSNQLHGRVPPELGDKLTRLKGLSLFGNSFTGTIPASLANLILDLGLNHLEGTITPDLGSIRGLQWLSLGYNALSGELPRSLLNLSSLTMLQLQGNMLHGSIPADIGSKFSNITNLLLGQNQLTGSIPASLSNLTTLREVSLITNRLSGQVPRTIGRLRALEDLSLHENLLEANDTEEWEFIASLSNCSHLQSFRISNNIGFTRQLPTSKVNLSATMQGLNLADTGITGTIPSAIGNLFNLQFFSVANTSISGVVPDSIGKLVNVVELTFLSRPIPSSIGNMSNLAVFYAFNSSLEGPIPKGIGNLKNLYSLDLNMNRLNSSIPIEIFRLPLLSRYLGLSYNLLSGSLPSEVGSLRNLNILSLSGNQLNGEIPDSIGERTVLQELGLDSNLFEGRIPRSQDNIKGLSALNLSMNKLSGVIPEDIGNLGDLRQLYQAHNNLSGTIPIVLQNLTLLIGLDLSFNNLQGEVPKEGIFKNLANLSITGNSGLCSGIPQLHVAKKLRRRHRSPSLHLKIEEHYERVSYHTLGNGTNRFSEANLLGIGSFGKEPTFPAIGDIYDIQVLDLAGNKFSERVPTVLKNLSALIALDLSFNNLHGEVSKEGNKEADEGILLPIRILLPIIEEQYQRVFYHALLNGTNGFHKPICSVKETLGRSTDALSNRRELLSKDIIQNLNNSLHNTLDRAQRLDIIVKIMDALDYLHKSHEGYIGYLAPYKISVTIIVIFSPDIQPIKLCTCIYTHTKQVMHGSWEVNNCGVWQGFCCLNSWGYSISILLFEMVTGGVREPCR
ncbi:hypothetical protein U9M48_020772 [Paspalum notatum var. saurae]|uniref:Leucine-rich repeat-containing N-terminal plant-type domain-containing protein n=1 Tax=Paspalum notatum var. saurae TaxID=547442 RepID=A0AAQ3TIZ8_PASNO